jgi:hypothetical protein
LSLFTHINELGKLFAFIHQEKPVNGGLSCLAGPVSFTNPLQAPLTLGYSLTKPFSTRGWVLAQKQLPAELQSCRTQVSCGFGLRPGVFGMLIPFQAAQFDLSAVEEFARRLAVFARSASLRTIIIIT